MLRDEKLDAHLQTMLGRILGEHFAWTDAGVVNALEAGADYVALASGEVLLTQGDAGDDVYFVLSGRLRAVAEGPEGTQRTLGEIGRGETIGELAFFTGEPRSATIVALRDSMVARVSRAVIEAAIRHSPQLAVNMARLVIERFRKAETARPPVSVPVNVCFLPISRSVDVLGLADALRRLQPAASGPIALLSGAAVSQRLGDTTEPAQWGRHGAVARHVHEVEEANAAVYFVADFEDTAWTQFCLQHADEVVLLGDSEADPALSPVESRHLGEAMVTIARRTLVLLHDAAKQSPRGTSRWLAPRGRPRHFHIRPGLDRDMARLARILSGRAVGVVLAGGGAMGFAHIGVYQALEAAGIDVDFVGGTSIGALVGTLMALDLRSAALESGVREAFLNHPKGNITGDYNLFPLVSLIKGARSRDSLARSVRQNAGAEIDMEDSWKTFFVIASNFSAGSEAVLSHGSLVRNVSASFAIPGALPPVLIDGHLLFDGGTFNNFPVDIMAGLGVGKVIGIDLSGDFGRRLDMQLVPGTLALLRDKFRPRAKQLYRRLPTMPETMMLSSFITSLSRQREQRRFADLLFRPRLPRTRLLDWHRFEQIVEAGREHAREVLGELGSEGLGAYR
jgi:NTE family protein